MPNWEATKQLFSPYYLTSECWFDDHDTKIYYIQQFIFFHIWFSVIHSNARFWEEIKYIHIHVCMCILITQQMTDVWVWRQTVVQCHEAKCMVHLMWFRDIKSAKTLSEAGRITCVAAAARHSCACGSTALGHGF